jgi:hypothetical protein
MLFEGFIRGLSHKAQQQKNIRRGRGKAPAIAS